MDESRKWSCSYCTYSNWPATKKCVMCGSLRPQLFITNDSDPDIYEVASLSVASHSVSRTAETEHALVCAATAANAPSAANASSLSLSASSSWSCKKCTYLNVARSLKCSMCGATRSGAKPAAEETTSAAAVTAAAVASCAPLLSVATGGGGADSSASASSQPNSQRNSPRSQSSPRSSADNSKELNNDKNRALASAAVHSVLGKWSCPACTYENYPKSLKCVLCMQPKATSADSPSALLTAVASDGRQALTLQHPGLQHLPQDQSAGEPDVINSAAAANVTTSVSEESHSRRLAELDRRWLDACAGTVSGNVQPVEAYLLAGGDPGRQLAADEARLLGATSTLPSMYEPGYTLLHLALRHGREDVLAALLGCSTVAAKKKKRLPPHVAPDLASDILRQVCISLRQRKGDFPCYFLSECVTFALPVEVDDFVTDVQDQLFADILDQDVQKELEIEESIINWSVELADGAGSRLYALWNRTAGDCLLDSVLQATWGVFDRDNTLRHALADSLTEGAMTFYPRWKEYETMQQTQLYDYSLDEDQWQQDWAEILAIASQPGSALEQMHIFALAHILRRPIIVYGVKYVKSFRGETIDLAKFQGVYLPLLWEASFCWKSPIALGYTRGHFSALVPMEVDTSINTGAGARIDDDVNEQVIYLPLVDSDRTLLPLHFLSRSQIGCEQSILRERLVCCHVSGILCAEQALGRQSSTVKQMVDEWLHRYRRLSHATAVNPISSTGHNINGRNVRDFSKSNASGSGGNSNAGCN